MTLVKRAIGRTGVEVTTFGMGGGPFGNLMTPMANADVVRVIDGAWTAGFRYFDTAPVYGFGLSEHEFELVRTLPDTSRCFLIKRGDHSVVARLDLSGLTGELAC